MPRRVDGMFDTNLMFFNAVVLDGNDVSSYLTVNGTHMHGMAVRIHLSSAVALTAAKDIKIILQCKDKDGNVLGTYQTAYEGLQWVYCLPSENVALEADGVYRWSGLIPFSIPVWYTDVALNITTDVTTNFPTCTAGIVTDHKNGAWDREQGWVQT